MLRILSGSVAAACLLAIASSSAQESAKVQRVSLTAIPLFGTQGPASPAARPEDKRAQNLQLIADTSNEPEQADPLVLSIDFMVQKIAQSPDQKTQAAFKQSVQKAVATHPSLRSSAQDVGIAASGADEAFAGLLPTVSLSGDAGSRRYGRTPVAGSIEQKQTGANTGLSLRQLVYDFGSTSSAYEAAIAKRTQADHEFSAARADLALRAVQAYVDVLRMRSHSVLAEQNKNARLKLLEQVSARAETGGGAPSDIIRAEARYVEAVANVSVVASKQIATESVFKEVFGYLPTDTLPLAVTPALKVTEGSLPELLRRFPAAAAKDAARLAADLESQSVRMRDRPRITAEISHNRQVSEWGENNLRKSDTTAVLALRYDIFTGGAVTARSEQATMMAGKAALEFDILARQFERALSQSRAEVKNSEDIKRARIRAARAAAASMRAVAEQFRFNRGTLLDALKTQEEAYIAGKDLIDSVADQMISHYRLLHLTSRIDEFFALADLKSSQLQGTGSSSLQNKNLRGPLN